MRVRITKPPPPWYAQYGESLLPGRIYNLDASLASALMLDGCADLYDTLTPEQKREFRANPGGEAWTQGGRPLWHVPRRGPQN